MFVIAPHARRLWAVVLLDRAARRNGLRVAALAVILVGSFGFTWWVANFNNRHPTPIDGVWQVVSGPKEGLEPAWQQVFFERNRASWVTFRAPDGTDEIHHFEVDEQGVIRIWQTWLKKGPLIMEGRLTDDGRLELDTRGAPNSHRIILQRQRPAP
jgi:hypothetical protein